MFRKALYLLPLLAITTNTAEARQQGDHHLIQSLTQDVELTDKQKVAFFDMRQDNRDKRVLLPKKNRLRKMILQYTKGDISAKEWHSQIDKRGNQYLEHRLSKMEDLHAILETYSEDQIDQVVENLNEKGMKPRKGKAKNRRGHGMKRLIKSLNPTPQQQKLIEELKNHKDANREARIENRNSKKTELIALLNGDVSLKSAQKTLRINHKEALEGKHDQVDIWIELIDSLDDGQRQSLIDSFNARKGKRHRR